MIHGSTPDLWRASGSHGAAVYFDMLRGLAPVRNVLGLSDPDVHRIDGRWVMFLGGFTTRLRVSLFTAVLPEGAPLASDGWALVTDRDTLYVFFTGTSAKVSWLRRAAERLARLRLPPVPSPYYLAVGRVALPGVRGRMPL